MASRRTLLPVLLLAFALVAAGGLMEGVRGAPRSSSSMSSVRRRLAGHTVGAEAATAPTTCLLKCGGLFPTCCRSLLIPICTNTAMDNLNCGSCGKICQLGLTCCGGVCMDPWVFQTDVKNCGKCGDKCAQKDKCIRGMCGYNL